MAYTKMNPQPAPRDSEDLTPERFDEVAPGLYPGEVAITFNSTHHAALSAEPKWKENGEGVRIRAWARYINTDGSTKVTAHGQQLETSTTFTFPPDQVKQYGVRPLAKEVVLLVLGEDPVLMRDIPQSDGTVVQRPVLDVSDMVRLNVSLREAVLAARDTAPEPDTATILGI